MYKQRARLVSDSGIRVILSEDVMAMSDLRWMASSGATKTFAAEPAQAFAALGVELELRAKCSEHRRSDGCRTTIVPTVLSS